MTFDQIMTELQKKQYRPIYFLMGDEAYFIDRICDYIMQNVLTDSEKSFNQTVLYGKDTDVATVDNIAKRFPMMAKNQVVVVKEAQDLKKIDDLQYYAQKPLKSTILVLCYKYANLPKNRKLYKAIEASGVIFESKKLYENQVPAWISEYLKQKQMSVDPHAQVLLTEFLGTDLNRIANELDKLLISLPVGSKVTADHVEENIGISKEFNNFELQKAIGEKDILKANRIVNYFGQNPKDNPMVVTVTSLFFFFSKLLVYHALPDKSQAASALKTNPYFLKDYQNASKRYPLPKVADVISLLREYDLKSKGVNNTSASEGDLLREMVFRIMH